MPNRNFSNRTLYQGDNLDFLRGMNSGTVNLIATDLPFNPRSQGGTDAYENLTLLCPPCNKEKRDRYTLVGLQQVNRAAGWMKNEGNLRMGRAAGRTGRRRRR